MKFSCDSGMLSKALSDVSHALSAKASLPILSHVLLEVAGGDLSLSATNLEIAIRTKIPVTAAEEGSACLPGRLFGELIGNLPGGEVEISEKNNIVSVKSAKTRAKVNGLNPAEFPKINLSGEAVLTLRPSEFVRQLQRVAFAAANDESRPILTGILLSAVGEDLTLVGVDGFRLSEKKMKLSGPADFRQVVPAKSLAEIGRLWGSEENLEILLSEAENQMVFRTKNTAVGARLLEGSFPEYQKIIPGTYTTKLVAEVAAWREALKVVSVFARDQNSVVKVSVSPEKKEMLLSSTAAEVGENETSVDVEIDSESASLVEVAFNARYLAEALGSFDSEKVEVRITGSLSPGVFVSPGDDSFLHLIMPIRIQS